MIACSLTAARLYNMNSATQYTVNSDNFSWHTPVPAATYTEALATAKARGFEATIWSNGVRVANWSPLYGTKVYNRTLAA